jgi:CubicO group peptidase (beta-lactamase class C family)
LTSAGPREHTERVSTGQLGRGNGGSQRAAVSFFGRIESASSMIPLLWLALAAGGASSSAGWRLSTPAAEGMTAGPLEAFDRDLADGRYGYVDSMLVIRHGKIVYEKTYDRSADYLRLFAGKGAPGIYNYYDPGWHPYYKRTKLHTMQSVSKSVTSALVGIAIGEGRIPGVDAKAMPYFSDFQLAPDARRDGMTIGDVLTMRTGIRWDEESTEYTDPRNNCAVMESKDDWVGYVLEQPMVAGPGTTFVYNSGATVLLSYLIWKATGQPADDYAKEHLFAPLGIEYFWKRTPKGLADTEGGLYLAPRDLAKIGLLYMKDGVWNGRRILPEGWARASTRAATSTNEKGYDYGDQWWVIPRGEKHPVDAFLAWGYGGQLLIVVPKLDLIAVFTGWNIYDHPELEPRDALERVLLAVPSKP